MTRPCWIALCFLAAVFPVLGSGLTIDSEFYHVRNAEPREWSHYPEEAERSRLVLEFVVDSPERFGVLTLRQEGTKQTWTVSLNGEKIGLLQRDHNHLEHGFVVPEGLLKETGNVLEVFTNSETPDDIHVGDVVLHEKRFDFGADLVGELEKNRGFVRVVPQLEGSLSLECRDEASGDPIPCRFTIVDAKTGALAFLGVESDDRLAVREGVIYTLDGKAEFAIDPMRDYRIYCGRGFEYSLEEASWSPGEATKLKFSLRREVDTPGLVACDTHLHTYEFDRHGDCTLTERIISAAGEGVELPISTAHDKHIDYSSEAGRIGADRWMTPVVGCEVTTSFGHFNAFPIDPAARPAEHKLRNWSQIFQNIFAVPEVKVCILNHGRDVHRNFTPLAPENFDLESGTFLNGRELLANGMEIINSGATQTDPMQLVGDWLALLESGHEIAAVGSSDSHTVNFAIPGQGRTYLRVDDGDPGAIDVNAAVDRFVAGETWVSFGLVAMLEIEGDSVGVEVLGPSWTSAARGRIFRNRELVMDFEIPQDSRRKGGEKFETKFSLADLGAEKGDFLCFVVTGPGISELYWPMMPPYQPDSPVLERYVFGMSPAVWIE